MANTGASPNATTFVRGCPSGTAVARQRVLEQVTGTAPPQPEREGDATGTTRWNSPQRRSHRADARGQVMWHVAEGVVLAVNGSSGRRGFYDFKDLH